MTRNPSSRPPNRGKCSTFRPSRSRRIRPTPSSWPSRKRPKSVRSESRKDYEKKIADGKKKVQELTDRFAAWYYVTPGDSFRSINLDRTALVRPKKADGSTSAGNSPLPDAGPSMLPPVQP